MNQLKDNRQRRKTRGWRTRADRPPDAEVQVIIVRSCREYQR